MATNCKHNSKLRLEGLCKPCSELEPYTIFRFRDEFGYVWGPDYFKSHPDCNPDDNEDQVRPYWTVHSRYLDRMKTR